MPLRLVSGLLLVAALACAQHRVDSRNMYNRVICVVPVIGKGTPDDPRRPQYAPWPPNPPGSRTGIIAFSQQLSDDGKFALVEFVAHDRSAFAAILSDKQIKIFEKGKDQKADIETELKKYKKDFDLATLAAVLP